MVVTKQDVVMKVIKNKKTGTMYVTVPKESGFEGGDFLKLIKVNPIFEEVDVPKKIKKESEKKK